MGEGHGELHACCPRRLHCRCTPRCRRWMRVDFVERVNRSRSGHTSRIGLAFQLVATPAWADRAHDLAAQAGGTQRRTCQNVTGLSTCHPQYPTGCSNSPNPQYDAYLNFLKNQMPAPNSSISRYIMRTT